MNTEPYRSVGRWPSSGANIGVAAYPPAWQNAAMPPVAGSPWEFRGSPPRDSNLAIGLEVQARIDLGRKRQQHQQPQRSLRGPGSSFSDAHSWSGYARPSAPGSSPVCFSATANNTLGSLQAETGQELAALQASIARPTRRTHQGNDTPAFPASSSRWSEGFGESPNAFANASRNAPAWWNYEASDLLVVDGGDTNGLRGGQKSGSGYNHAGTAMQTGTSTSSRCPGKVETQSPNRSLPNAHAHWTVLPPKGPATSELCCFCFAVLLAHLQHRTPPSFPLAADPFFKAPLFVTWMKRDATKPSVASDLELRGCIGCLEPVVFSPGISEYSLRSSLQDKRFPPIQLDELPSLTCKLSILYQFEPCLNADDWQVGVHGIIINFCDAHGRRYSATYLPEIPLEHGMTRDVAIRELVAKSGYPGPCGEELLARMQVTRYQTLVEGLTYWEYLCLSGSEAFCRPLRHSTIHEEDKCCR